MINNDTAKSTYTVTDGVTEYPIVVQYTTKPDGTPNLYVCTGDLYGDNVELEYGTGYNLSADGLSIVLLSAVEDGTTLNIAVDEQFIQDSDYVIGRIDSEQIERDFDKSVLRDLQLRDYADDINDRLEDEVQARTNADAGLQDAIDDEVAARSLADTTLQNNIDAEADAREDADTALQTAINAKQDIIVDLANIRSGAAAGATAVQPSDLSTVATTGSYNDLSNKPRYAASIRLSIDPSTFVVTAQLKDQDNNNIGTAQTIDLPLESVVVSGAYDSATREVVLTLEGGSTIRFSVADLVSGLQTEITSSNKLDADLVDDSTSANKFVTAAEKTAISTAVQRGDNVSDLTNDVGYVTGTDVAADYVAKTGDTMTGALNINRESSSQLHYASALVLKATYNGSGDPITISANPSGFLLIDKSVMLDGNLTPNGAGKRIGTSSFPWSAVCTTTINNGADITVPTTGGTMARVEDLPSVMTGADGTNAGTSGLVPAPAATDNDKFLSGDGTWKAAGGGATYTAGNGISIDANNEISVAVPTLVNNSTNANSIGIGVAGSTTGNGAIGIGRVSVSSGNASIALGYRAYSTANNAIQLSASLSMNTNADANTFKVANANGNFEIMSADGTIPTDRLTHAINKYSSMPTASASNEGWIVQFTGTTDSTHTHGYIYECKAQGTTPETYAWEAVEVQASSGGLPSQTGQSGKFLTTDGTDASWSDKPLVNKATGSNSIGISRTSITATGAESIAIGTAASTSNRSYNIAIGHLCSALRDFSIALGKSAEVYADGAMQINMASTRRENRDANTVKIGNANGNFEIMSADGTVPTARLTKVNTTATLAVADWSSSTQTVSVTGMTADGVVFVNPTPANQSAYTSAGILCTAQAAGSLTFTCDTVPSADITVTVVML